MLILQDIYSARTLILTRKISIFWENAVYAEWPCRIFVEAETELLNLRQAEHNEN